MFGLGRNTQLGHVDFLGQELAASPQAAQALLTANIGDEALVGALAATGGQTGGRDLLASMAAVDERAGLLVVAAGRNLPAHERRLLLAELRHHHSKRVRDRARHVLLAGADARLFPELSPREEEILEILATGGTNQVIAEQLSLTLATVKTHVHRILTKIDARGRLTAAVAYQQRAASSRTGESSDFGGLARRRRAGADALRDDAE